MTLQAPSDATLNPFRDMEVPLGFLHDLTRARSMEAVCDAYMTWGAVLVGPVLWNMAIQSTPDNMTLHTAQRNVGLHAPHEHPVADTVLGKVLLEQKSRFISNVEESRYEGCRKLARFGVRSVLMSPLVADQHCFGVIAAGYPATQPPTSNAMTTLKVLADAFAAQLLLVTKMSELTTMSQTDALTGAYNRHHIQRRAAQHWTDWRKMGQPYCIASVDLDHFKVVNDTLGHAIGDAVLCQTVARLKRLLRVGDSIVRMGGEEFCILLAGVGHGVAHPLIERMHAAFTQAPFKTDKCPVAVTASIGVASIHRSDSSFEDTLKRSDAALYTAKANGRNRVEVHTPNEGQ